MKLVKRITGGVIVVVGAIGVAFGIYAVFETWSTADRFGREIPQAIGQIETIVRSVLRHGKTAAEVLKTTRNRLHLVLESVEDLSRNRRDRQDTFVLNRLDIELVERLEHAEEFLRSMQVSLESSSGAVLLLESIPFFGPRISSPTANGESNMRSLASSLTEVSNGLEQMIRVLSEIRTKRNVDPADVAHLQNALGRMDEQLEQVQSDIEVLSAETNALAAKLAGAKTKSSHWVERTAAICTMFFVCFSFSQLHLLVQGLRLMRVRSHSAGTGSCA